MIVKATGAGLIDQPPLFGLSRTYNVIAKGVVQTLLNPTETLLTVLYGPGQPALGVSVAGPAIGFSGLDPDRYATACLGGTAWTGIGSLPFCTGLSGIVENFRAAASVTDLLTPTGNGVGNLTSGGIIFDADACFEHMKDEATADSIMVVVLGVHTSDPLGTIEDPTTGAELEVGDLFSQAEVLLRTVSTLLAVELLFGQRLGIPVVGAFNPLDLPIISPTITAVLA